MKYFIIAGEASGDLHGSNLMKALLAKDPQAEFQFWGGDRMAAVSDGLLMHHNQHTVMGFVEVVLSLRSIQANMNLCKQQIEAFQPHVVILIDYAGFNLRIAQFCKSIGIRTAFYISPKVWAWNEKRVHKLEQYVDKLLLIFPFEVEYFKQWKVDTVFVGNPLLDAIADFAPNQSFRQQNKLDQRPILALMPGSRKQEIARILPKMMEATSTYTDYQLVIAGAPGMDPAFYTPYLNSRVSIVFNQTYDLLLQSTAAVVCSGTATLETALLNIPQVCGYVANPVSYRIGRLLVKVKFISLVNLILNRESIKELIQDDLNPTQLKRELDAILPGGAERNRMLTDYVELQNVLGGKGASARAAEIVNGMARNR